MFFFFNGSVYTFCDLFRPVQPNKNWKVSESTQLLVTYTPTFTPPLQVSYTIHYKGFDTRFYFLLFIELPDSNVPWWKLFDGNYVKTHFPVLYTNLHIQHS